VDNTAGSSSVQADAGGKTETTRPACVYEEQHPMKNQLRPTPKTQAPPAALSHRSGGPPCPWTWALISLLGLTLVFAAAWHTAAPANSARRSGTQWGSGPGNYRVSGYLQRGQWRADARTLAAIFCYLVSPETPPSTNRNSLPA